MRTTILAAALAVSASAADAAMVFDPSGPYDVQAAKPIWYAAPAADTLTICRPVAKSGSPDTWQGPRMAVLLIHGGGWDGGTSDVGNGEYTGYSGSWCRLVASWGLVGLSVGYRLQARAASTKWPAAFIDVQAAVRYVRANADRLGVDPRLVAAWGDSAGASLALQLGFTRRVLPSDLAGENPDFSPQVQAVVDAFGPWTWGPSSAAAPLPADAARLAAEPNSGVGPTAVLIIQGEADRIVPKAQSYAAYCYFRSTGTPANYISYPYGHEYGGWDGPSWMPLVARLQVQAVSFLFAQGHAAASGGTPVIPPGVAGPGLPFSDPTPPSCE